MADGTLTLDGLRTLRGLVDELDAVLEREHAEITARADPATIEATAQEKLRLFEAIDTCPEPAPPGEDADSALQTEWQALRDTLARVNRRNERNGIAIARVLETVGEEVALLTGRERDGETYGPGGGTASGSGRLRTSA
ncbi:hypothetical protein KBTX_03505 [wastewater metagenome]|uniref:FlgN protein n=2 Tax=unclassified sequences TaxID=12908 RepID=A0A5B8RE77_9ZZZZ|nr:flagellar protein FlgN [Arhodomonas aquaeolei]QEA07160.1 hypothetical protein KBTEX_03505 [uncultured organism]